jgi:hypothetical protein
MAWGSSFDANMPLCIITSCMLMSVLFCSWEVFCSLKFNALRCRFPVGIRQREIECHNLRSSDMSTEVQISSTSTPNPSLAFGMVRPSTQHLSFVHRICSWEIGWDNRTTDVMSSYYQCSVVMANGVDGPDSRSHKPSWDPSAATESQMTTVWYFNNTVIDH